MKFVLILLFPLFALLNTVDAQKITLSEKDVPLEKVFKEIRRQSGYNFIYNSQMLREANPVSIVVKNAGLKSVLDLCFAGQPITYLINRNTVVVKWRQQPAAPANQLQLIKGLVRDEQKAALPGVSVYLKDEKKGTVTDADGRYMLEVPDDTGILVFSYMGFQSKEIAISSGGYAIVDLQEDTKGLAELVVVGYGTQKKLTVTGSVSSVKGSELRQNPSASLQNTLSGRLPGFFSQQRSGIPGSDGAAFYIRGVSTFSNGAGANQPLIIVDDVESTYDQVARIDANEIESISILKDASTTAVYGIKGANGVMVITTRRGQAGPAKISLRTET
ncbi:TonB-dependent SusC/RagA subfamily outer membrane receptor, partial [Pedobacter sp. AK017]|uniref:SusC/RagA family TonB-linked outer membrane protein n=1 Tax=Pedobacter sp. AK017 TaxID=2723073 RepID=UPI001617818D